MPETIARTNPFPGLRAFEPDEDYLFFGREKQVDELLSKLRTTRFLPVIGNSGSGKSSLVKSGLIPSLYRGYMSGAGSHWQIALFRPGNNPIGNMAKALSRMELFNTKENDEAMQVMQHGIIDATLRRSTKGLVKIIESAQPEEDQHVLIIVDQFEELFRFNKREQNSKHAGKRDAMAFVNLLLYAAQQKDIPLYIAITMRSDFLGDCTQFSGLPEAINKSQYLIPRMSREERKAAITGPVAIGGAAIDPPLLARLLNDVGDNMDQLPILQHALMRTWNYWEKQHKGNEAIGLRHYEAIGTMEKALSQHAEEAWAELQSEEEQRHCELLFKALTEQNEQGRGIRRPCRLGDLCTLTGATQQEMTRLIDLFRSKGRTFLMPPEETVLDIESVIDISHESIMRIWKRLSTWVEEEAQAAEMYLRLTEAAALHRDGKAGLWRNPELMLALSWKDANQPTAAWATRYDTSFEEAISFLKESNTRYQLELATKEREQKAKIRRARTFALVVAIAALLAAGLSVWAIDNRNKAEQAKAEAVSAQQKAEKNEKQALVARQEAQVSEKKAVSAQRKAEDNEAQALQARKESEQQRLIAEGQRKIAIEEKGKAEQARKVAETQRGIAEQQSQKAQTEEQKAFRLRMLSIAQSMAAKSLQVVAPDEKALMARQAFLFNETYEGNPYDPDIYTALHEALEQLLGNDYSSIQGHKGAVRAIAFSPSGDHFYTTGSDGRCLRWKTAHPPKHYEQLTNDNTVNRSLAISPDGQWLAGGNGTAHLWLFNLLKPEEKPQKLRGPEAELWDMLFLPDGSGFICSYSDKTLYFCDLNSFTPLLQVKSRVRDLAISPDGTLLAGADESGKLKLWEFGQDRSLVLRSEEKGAIQSVAFSPDGRWLASGNEKGLVTLRDLNQKNKPVLLNGHSAPVNDLEFTKDGNLLAAASFDGSVRLWNLRQPGNRPIVMDDHASWVWDIAFSSDDQYLLSSCKDRSIRSWPVNSRSMAEQICEQLTRNMSTEEWRQYVGSDIPYEKTCEAR